MRAERREINEVVVRCFALLAFVSAVMLSSTLFASSDGTLQDYSPQAISQQRVKLYFAAAREPLVQLASRIYLFAADSERCRLNDGAKPCGLQDDPLKSTELQPIFNYYVKQPIEAGLNRRQITTHKSDWTWQPYVKQH